MKILKYIYFLTFFFICSCRNISLYRELNMIVGSEIIMPSSLIYYPGTDSTFVSVEEPFGTMIIWYDSTECSSCKLTGLWNYYSLEHFCRDSVDNINVSIIFSPLDISHETFCHALEEIDRKYPVYADFNNEFFLSNPQIPENKFFHTLLIDKNNKVVLAGDANSYKMLNQYKKQMLKLSNDSKK